ncbi:unnamed protein product [Parnassius mnemosyne]|uniref:RNA-directed DNA polymerase n=2 Tax=Parnassius mnemosyne TaxID=213953 RepID=A0AAV1LAA0_9NEOP
MIFNQKLHTKLQSDASSIALAAILMQKNEEGEMHPVYYRSRRTNDIESCYSSYDLEALAVIEGVKKFHHYLFGSEYDYDVEHRAGCRMPHADALSRIPYVAAVVTLHEKISQAQERDEDLKAIKQLILTNGQYNDHYMEQGVLYKGDQRQLVVPELMKKEVIKEVHNNGHFAMKKMKEAISKDYFIKNMDRKIEGVITSFIPRVLATRKEGKQEGYLNPIGKEGTPLHTLHLDHIGPLTETRKMYNHILTVVDGFTKFVWLYPTKSTTSAEVISKLQLHQDTFANPVRIITDRGTAFTSGAFKKYCEEEGIQHVTITTGIPRGNGQVERVHRIMIPMLTKLCIEDQSLWYKHVGRVQRAINSTYQRSIDTTPFQLLTGTKMNCKEDVEILNLLLQETIEQYSESRESLRQKARDQIQKIQEENRNTYNKKRKQSSQYEVGDLVTIKRTQFGPGLKLKAKFFGPYKVVKVKRNDRYDVVKLYQDTEGPNSTATSADFMKRWPEEDDCE